jgi:hydroxyacylglutathione hydrolase
MPEWTVWDLDKEMKKQGLLILDVRQPNEWRAGHIEGAMYLSGAELPKRVSEIPKDRPVAVICGSGYRSSVSASLLLREGHPDVTNVLGGMAAWKKAGLPVTKG